MMAGLVEYGSSEEEDNVRDNIQVPYQVKTTDFSNIPPGPPNNGNTEERVNGHLPLPFVPAVEPDAPIVGPAPKPSGPIDDYMLPHSPSSEDSVPLSPYSASRAQIRQLTLPPIPNPNIPPSPPGSPSSTTNAKFAHFLDLKKQGIHFNEKLAKSSALRNPNLMEKLMDFADIDDAEQYGNTLPKEVWNPQAFPEWAYKEELAKSQQRISKKLEEAKTVGQRESIDFVPDTASGDSSRGGSPRASSGQLGPKSAAERVMAGLDRGRSSPGIQSGTKKTRFESPGISTGTKRKTRFES